MKKRIREVLWWICFIGIIVATLAFLIFDLYIRYKVVDKVVLQDNNTEIVKTLTKDEIVPNSDEEPEPERPADIPANIIIPGYFGQVRTEDVINFANPNDNGCNMVFTLYLDTVEIWTSGPVAPGDHAEFDARSAPGQHTYKLEIKGQTFSGEDLSGADGTITIGE